MECKKYEENLDRGVYVYPEYFDERSPNGEYRLDFEIIKLPGFEKARVIVD